MLHNAGFIISLNCRIVKIELFLVLLQLLYSLDIGKQTVPRVINYGAKVQVQQDKTLHAPSFFRTDATEKLILSESAVGLPRPRSR